MSGTWLGSHPRSLREHERSVGDMDHRIRSHHDVDRHELSATFAWSITALGFQQATFAEPAGQQRRDVWYAARQRNLPGKSTAGGQQFVRRTPRSGKTILCILPLGT